MKTRNSRIWDAVRLTLAACFAVQTMVVPGLHRHPAGSHDPVAEPPGSSRFVGACVDEVGDDTRLSVCVSHEPGLHVAASDCPACMFLKNFQGRLDIGKIPVPTISPDNHAPLCENLHYASCTVVSSLPRGPPTT